MPALLKTYGNQIVSEMNPMIEYDVVSTGSLNLDDALGVGGYVKGRIYEIFGPESSGKSTMCLHAVAEVQKAGGLCAYVDVEHALDPAYATSIGVNLNEVVISQPDSAEDALNIVNAFMNQGVFDLVILDSIAAMVPRKELEGEIGDSNMAIVARLMAQAMRKMVSSASNNNCALLAVNQFRNKIGIMFGDPRTTVGGDSMKYAASVRMEVSKSPIKDGDEVYGNKTKVKVIKNKLAPPFKSAEFDVLYGTGIDRVGEVLDQCIKREIVKKGGAWLSYNDLKIQGTDKFKQLMIDNEDLYAELEAALKTK